MRLLTHLLHMAVVAVLAVTNIMPVQAEGLTLTGSKKNRTALFRSQTSLLDGRLASQYDYSQRLTPNAPKNDKLDASALKQRHQGGSYKGKYLEAAKAAARKHDVPEDLFVRLVHHESGWRPGAVSVKGATGLAQLMPETANHMGVDINDPLENLDGGARYLRMMYDRFGSWRLALAAYNAGPQAVEKHGDIPPYTETKNYVLAILD